MEEIHERLSQSLQHYPSLQTALWPIVTREGLFRHLSQQPSNLGRHFTYSIRIDGALKCLGGFVDLVNDVISAADSEVHNWRAMIWGSSALILAHLHKRRSGHEQILVMFEDLAVTTNLPCAPQQTQSEHYSSFVLQLFAELATRLLDLALALEKYPQAPQQKHIKFVEFEKEHMYAIQRIQMWTERLRGISSNETPRILPVNLPSPLPSERIPISVNRYFHGREEHLGTLRRALCSALERPAIACVHGLPGMGKTQLAAKYCKVFGSSYFACIWVTASGTTKVGQGLSDCAVKMQLPGTSITTEPRKNAQVLVSWLQTTDKPWLVVFDNVDDCHDLEDFWPSGGAGHIIMTSRSPYIAEFRGSTPLKLEPLSPSESKDLFYSIVGDDRVGQPAQNIDAALAEWEGVPLALFHIGSYIKRLHIDLNRFVKLYRRYATEIYQTRNLADEYPHTIATAFSIGELEGDMKSLLRVLCCLDPDKIPSEMLLSGFDCGPPPLAIASEIGFYNALDSLCRSGLVSQTDTNLTVHRLVQTVGFSSMCRDDKIDTLRQVLSLLDRVFPREVEGKPMWSDWPRCDSYMPHVLFLTRRWREIFDDDHKDTQLARLLSACTWYMVERGLFTEAESLLVTARAVCPDSEEARQTLATVLFNLAGVRFECNRIPDSLQLCKEVVEIREKLPDPFDPLLGNIMYSIGIVYMENGQLKEALGSCLRAVEIHEFCQSKGRHDGSPTALAYLDVGLVYWKMGELESASHFITKGLEIFERTTGKCSQKYGQGLSYLALVKEAQGKLDEAMEATLTSLQICQATTPTGFKTAFGLHKMAGFLQREGRLEEALLHIENALLILEGTFDSMPRVARSMFKMSEILEKMGRQDEAAVKRKEANRLRNEITTIKFDPGLTEKAFDTLIPSFLC